MHFLQNCDFLVLKVLEKEIVDLASDAATLISRGDGLVLLVHTSDPERADLLKKTSQDRLRSKWSQVMSETEVNHLVLTRILHLHEITLVSYPFTLICFSDTKD